MARRQGFFDDLMSIGLKLPWKVALAATVIIFATLHMIAIETQEPVTATTLPGLGGVVQHGIIHVFAALLQYLIPAALLIGATVGYFRRRQSGALFVAARANPKTAITSMNWRDFERLVGEAFRQQGFTVTGFGGQGPDGGVDLGLSKNGERFLVQCKHWRKQQVGVTVVRELNGVIAAQGARGGFVVTGGQFTKEAQEFTGSCNITLIDGPALAELIGGTRANSPTPTSTPELTSTVSPTCPKCGTPMVQRKAKQGKFAGRSFWGCRSYPQCTEIRQTS
jgi:restriction system protein